MSFRLTNGLAEHVHYTTTLAWLGVILALMPVVADNHAGPWSRVGLRQGADTFDFSLPMVAHADSATELQRAGLTVVRLRMVREAPRLGDSRLECA